MSSASGPSSSPQASSPAANTGNAGAATLLSPLFMQSLDKLDVLSRKILTGKLQGDRRSKQRGQSVEFADYRPYVAGDDLRFIDWNLFARLDKLFLRLFMEEQDLSVTIAVDLSRSMHYGKPDKSHYARQLAAALGYISLVNFNRVSVMAFSDGKMEAQQNLRGRRPIKQMLGFISRTMPAPAAGPTSLAQFTRKLVLSSPGKGMIILISDFMDKGDMDEALAPLASDRWDVHALQVLSPQEMDPRKDTLVGDMQLRDMEDDDLTDVTMSPELLKRYQENLEAYCAMVRQSCLKRNVSYALAESGVPFETMVLQHLRQRGLLG